nr:hypothetical protein Iba_chr08aCG0710 [Ipomoea batatas]
MFLHEPLSDIRLIWNESAGSIVDLWYKMLLQRDTWKTVAGPR